MEMPRFGTASYLQLKRGKGRREWTGGLGWVALMLHA